MARPTPGRCRPGTWTGVQAVRTAVARIRRASVAPGHHERSRASTPRCGGLWAAHPEEVTITKLTGSRLIDAGATAGIATGSTGAPHERSGDGFVSPGLTPLRRRILARAASDHRPLLVAVRRRESPGVGCDRRSQGASAVAER